MADRTLPTEFKNAEVDAFLKKVAAIPAPARSGRGRLIFAMDATASREATWRHAQSIHAHMFQAATNVGAADNSKDLRAPRAVGMLDIQLVYYRGMGECRAGKWTGDPDRLLAQLRSVACIGGQTQIGKVLAHAIAETRKAKVHALVFVGDCMEEDVDQLCAQAGELGLLGVPIFLFHEGDNQDAARAFRQMAKLSGGACYGFDAGSAHQLRDLLSAVAIFAAGGRKALMDHGREKGGVVLQLTRQMGR